MLNVLVMVQKVKSRNKHDGVNLEMVTRAKLERPTATNWNRHLLLLLFHFQALFSHRIRIQGPASFSRRSARESEVQHFWCWDNYRIAQNKLSQSYQKLIRRTGNAQIAFHAACQLTWVDHHWKHGVTHMFQRQAVGLSHSRTPPPLIVL